MLERIDADRLIAWYRKHKRTLPWRETGDPADVWISEIMLQQTRVEAVKRYFTRFREALPDIRSVAECPEDRLLVLWEGLGYYSRARNIKKCAEKLIRDFGGELPADYEELKKLPGIGSYTAGAIASIAFGIPVPAVDGNVLRVYARLEGIPDDIRLPETKERFRRELAAFLEGEARGGGPGLPVSEFTQALMELGALVCVPNGEPDCGACPWRERCAAHRSGRTEEIPYRTEKKARRVEERTILVIRGGDRFYFRKRPEKGLLAGLYEFPGAGGHLSEEEAVAEVRKMGFDPLRVTPLPEGKHIFTHVEWRMKAYEIRVASLGGREDALFVTREELKDLAVPSAFRTWIRYFTLKDGPEGRDGRQERA